jgi:N-acetyl-gamma-glutamyl-phosphate reductase
MSRERIRQADSIANPGCFATCLQLGMLPLAASGLLQDDVHISATTGSTGAGQKPTASTHFSWRANNLSAYKAFEHQHLHEIGENILALQPGWGGEILFIPMRGAFTRGIFATIHTHSDLSAAQATELYKEYYAGAAFTFVSGRAIDLKQVVNTNKCLVHVEKYGDNRLITSAIDNLLKGASGQAVQNMNLMLGLDERAGLRLKAAAF